MTQSRKKRKAKASKTPGITPVVTVPQEHGGALRVGNPGNAGGPGRPPSAVRAACAESFDTRIPVLEQIADDPKVSKSDRLKAMDLLGKYGGLLKAEIGGSLGIDGILNDLDDQPDDPE